MSNIPAADLIQSVVSRVERLNGEIKALNDDKAELWQEAKSSGLAIAVLKDIVRTRAKDPQKVREAEELRDLYMAALESKAS